MPKLMNRKEATGGKNRSRLVTRASLTITRRATKDAKAPQQMEARSTLDGVCGMIHTCLIPTPRCLPKKRQIVYGYRAVM
jgi:hypothetical protein